jgi:polyphosphate kinase
MMTRLETPPAGENTSATDPHVVAHFFNRDLSWLDFNYRVLHEAMDGRNPLLERLKFLAIFASNNDEFFMKRMAGLKHQAQLRPTEVGIDGLTHRRQYELIRHRVAELLELQDQIWKTQIKPALRQHGILIQDANELSPAHQQKAAEYFRQYVYPVLTPLAVDPGHPFPFISNLSLSVGVLLSQPGQVDPLFARVKVPRLFSRWYQISNNGETIFIPLESLIESQLGLLFPGMRIHETCRFRVTRNAIVAQDAEDAEDLLEEVQEQLRARRFAETVRVEISANMSAEMRQYILDGLEVTGQELFEVPDPLGVSDLMQMAAVQRPDLKLPPWKPVCTPPLADLDANIFAIIRQGDVLVHHPYEGFSSSVERFILSAVDDPKVLAIKMTLYRTSGDSPFVAALARAAESGKQVAALVELKARFDEESNIQWAQALESAGVHVVYGMLGLKTHTKIALIVRQEDDGMRSYAHISTGNYNSRTAQLYTDLGLFTCREDICADIVDLFAYLTGRSLKSDYRKLLVAPVNMRKRFLDHIDREIQHAAAGRPARIIAKMNALEDVEIIDALYHASQAGVEIDLIVRGFCCLKPGVPGLSDRIRVCSIIGRFLEHSRMFWFQNGGKPEVFMGSADWMSRNLSHRVEAAVPVETPALTHRIEEILHIMLADQRQAWDLGPTGVWTQRQPTGESCQPGTHALLMELTEHRQHTSLAGK